MKRLKGWVASVIAASGLFAGCASEMSSEDDPELNQIRQEAVASINGLLSVNGLTSVNGLISVNGLSTTNGLRSVNGLLSVNGLRSVNGLLSVNGLSVDCTGKTAGVSCTGEPDGMLSNSKGLMSNDKGIMTAKYLMRCALPKGDSIRIKDYTGGLVSLTGELGLTPGWKDGQCDEACQQKISACLMAFTNGDGAHVDIELAAPFTLGTSHSYPYQEASFYGNLFQSNPKAFYCVGKDYAISGTSIKNLETRACVGYNAKTGSCPYVRAGYCENAVSLNLADNTVTGDRKCSYGLGSQTASSCKDSSGGLLAKSWAYPITTFRKVQQ